ncbi:MAG: ATP-binding protein [Candidatus Aenigmarchaeota archaeon]|nr:ATP-binding protein [Candidatus Aenigmarchaeota archaeon]
MAAEHEYGTVISTIDSPTTRKFSFVIAKSAKVRRGQFVQIGTEDGSMIGRVADIRKTNRYFLNPESVNNVELSKPMHEAYPTWEWEYLVADAIPLGVHDGEGFSESLFPPSPGDKVVEPEAGIVEKFFGIDPRGIEIGSIRHHDIKVKLNMDRLLQKHLAILAISGAGKSYLAGAIIEELLDRQPDSSMAVIVLDTHGEYTAFADDPKYAAKVKTFASHEIQIGTPNLSQYEIGEFAQLTTPQIRELARAMKGMGRNYGMAELMARIENDKHMNVKTKDTLLSALDELHRLGIFGVSDYPTLDDMAQLGRLAVIDLSETIGIKKKQILVAYLARKLFESRRNGVIPPFLLLVEEAHQFVPEKTRQERALSRGILQTIAREGRKFHACLCLVSQRPVHLSTTILSQCNSNIILRVTNPYDLQHIGQSSEGISKDVLDQIAGLQVGSALVVGEAVNFPLFVRVRKRKGSMSKKGMPLEQAAKEYFEKVKKKAKDAKSFM